MNVAAAPLTTTAMEDPPAVVASAAEISKSSTLTLAVGSTVSGIMSAGAVSVVGVAGV